MREIPKGLHDFPLASYTPQHSLFGKLFSTEITTSLCLAKSVVWTVFGEGSQFIFQAKVIIAFRRKLHTEVVQWLLNYVLCRVWGVSERASAKRVGFFSPAAAVIIANSSRLINPQAPHRNPLNTSFPREQLSCGFYELARVRSRQTWQWVLWVKTATFKVICIYIEIWFFYFLYVFFTFSSSRFSGSSLLI